MRRILARAFLPLALLAWGPLGLSRGSAETLASRVVLVANAADPDSVSIAEHYARVRGVPPENIVTLRMSQAQVISWREFISTIWQPLQDELIRRRWIGAVTEQIGSLSSPLTDPVGRRKYLISGHRIAALVLCRGVPLRIDNDPALAAPPLPPFMNRPEFRTNAGAVDSELSLVARNGGYPINGFVPNPIYGRDQPSQAERAGVVEVSRLDGPTAGDARALVDRAVQAEAEGLIGRAYVVIDSGYAEGNRWLERVSSGITSMGFETTTEREKGGLPVTARCDAPVLYFGLHEPDLNGPFALPGFRFPPGAIALHIHSYSATTLRSSDTGWCGPLLARGVTATVGNVNEPYLQCLHRPDLLLRALARGQTLADAAYYALPVLSWQSVLIGDPLYRPFAVPLREQLRDIGRLPPELAGYPVLRLMALLEAQGRPAEAVSIARAALRGRPGLLPLRLALAERLAKQGNPGEIPELLAPSWKPGALPADQWGLVRETAQFLAATGHPAEAVRVYRRLLALEFLPPAPRARWLVEAIAVGKGANDPAQVERWRKDLDDLAAQTRGDR
jgi:uncharacterized protein (TIGR03790 family)